MRPTPRVSALSEASGRSIPGRRSHRMHSGTANSVGTGWFRRNTAATTRRRGFVCLPVRSPTGWCLRTFRRRRSWACSSRRCTVPARSGSTESPSRAASFPSCLTETGGLSWFSGPITGIFRLADWRAAPSRSARSMRWPPPAWSVCSVDGLLIGALVVLGFSSLFLTFGPNRGAPTITFAALMITLAIRLLLLDGEGAFLLMASVPVTWYVRLIGLAMYPTAALLLRFTRIMFPLETNGRWESSVERIVWLFLAVSLVIPIRWWMDLLYAALVVFVVATVLLIRLLEHALRIRRDGAGWIAVAVVAGSVMAIAISRERRRSSRSTIPSWDTGFSSSARARRWRSFCGSSTSGSPSSTSRRRRSTTG
jgi:hypothetical protein